MSYNYNSKASSTKKPNKFKQKLPINLKGKTHYISLVQDDALYEQNLFKLSNKQYQFCIQKILLDLNALLHFTQQDFLEQLQTQDSLRVCLQSCLVSLGKNAFYRLNSIKKSTQSNASSVFSPQENKYFIYYQKLHEVLLKIYIRVVTTTDKQFKEIIYNSWLLDIAKMIDLALTYVVKKKDVGQQEYYNLQIIKFVISKAIQSNPRDYQRDFDDFVNTLYENRIPMLMKDVDLVINLSDDCMKKAKKNFQNPLRSFLISANKIIFGIKDLFTSILYIYLTFPQSFKYKLASDHEIQQMLLKIFIEFNLSTAQWKTTQFSKQFQMNFSDIKKTICQCMYQNTKIVKQMIQKGEQPTNSNYSRALSTYSVYCLYLTSQKIDLQNRQLCKQLFQTIMLTFSQTKSIFFLKQAPPNLKYIKLSQQQKKSIQKCYKLGLQMQQQLQSHKQQKQIQKAIQKRIQQFFIKQGKTQVKNSGIQYRQKYPQRRKVFNKKNITQKQLLSSNQDNIAQNISFKKPTSQNNTNSTKNTSQSVSTKTSSQQRQLEKNSIAQQQQLILSKQKIKNSQQESDSSIIDFISIKDAQKKGNQNQYLDLSFEMDQKQQYQEEQDQDSYTQGRYNYNEEYINESDPSDLSYIMGGNNQEDSVYLKTQSSLNSSSKNTSNMSLSFLLNQSLMMENNKKQNGKSKQMPTTSYGNFLDQLYAQEISDEKKAAEAKIEEEIIKVSKKNKRQQQSEFTGKSKKNKNKNGYKKQQTKQQTQKTTPASNNKPQIINPSPKTPQPQIILSPQQQKLHNKHQLLLQKKLYQIQQQTRKNLFYKSTQLYYQDDYQRQIPKHSGIQQKYDNLNDFFTVIVEGQLPRGYYRKNYKNY